MKIFPLLFICLLFLTNTAIAQEPCYGDKRTTGLKFLNNNNYRAAIESFRGARFCQDLPEPNDLDKLINEAQDKWVKELETARDKALAAQRAEEAAKEEAIKAKDEAEKAKKLAVENAQKAREQGRKAESLLLFLHSENTLQKGEGKKALLLSLLGLLLAEDEVLPSGERAFFEAVRHNKTEVRFEDTSSIQAVHLLPGGKKVLVKTGRSVQLVNMGEEGKLQLPLKSRPSLSATPSQDGKYLASWSDEGRPELWNSEGRKMGEFAGHNEPVRAAVFSRDNKWLLTCSRDNTARLWDLNGNVHATFAGHTGNIYEAVFSPNEDRIVTRSADGTARIWDREGNSLAVLGQNEVYINDIAFSPDGQYVATATAAGLAKTWDLNGELQSECKHREPVKEILFPDNGAKLLTRGLKTAKIWDLECNLTATLTHNGQLLGVNLDERQNQILTWSDDYTARLWDTNGTLLQTFSGHKAELISAFFCPGYDFILTTSLDGTAKLWDKSGIILMDWDLEADTPLPVFFSTDGKHIVAVTENREVLAICPIPPEIFKEMERDLENLKDDFLELEREYGLQFLDEVLNR